MFANLTSGLDFQSKALLIRADRQRLLASNIANVDTPGYSARDINFKDAMQSALGHGSNVSAQPAAAGGPADARHIPLQSTLGSLGTDNRLDYSVQSQPSLDGNSVDLDQQRANFVDNAVRYEATLRFINGASKTMLSAIQGQ